MNKLLFLGTGSSVGIPVIGCRCDVCLSKNGKNHRLRTAALLQIGHKKFLIDIGPDFREQALIHQIDSIDGLIITHAHYDHIGGLDELRAFQFKSNRRIPCFLSKETYEEIKVRFYYIMRPLLEGKSACAQLDFHVLEEERGESSFMGEKFRFFSYEQGGMQVTGIRVGSLAYVTDIKEYPDTIFEDLKGIETLVISCIGEKSTPLHFGVEEAIAFGKKVEAKKVYFTHISHRIEHEEIQSSLPEGFCLAYDGLEIGW